MSAPDVVLASTSRYRAELLRRLVATFEQVAPDASEGTVEGESPRARAGRLAAAKAAAVANGRDNALVIGSDQVASLGGEVLHKPDDFSNAREQLLTSSGNTIDFFTGLCVYDTRTRAQWAALDHTRVAFRDLTGPEIDRYLEREQPFDCAGSFKCEGSGIALVERIETSDPTALIGLPLIALARLLRAAGLALP